MKQLIQSFKTGELGLFDVPSPLCQDKGSLVQTSVSFLSAGTEKMLVDFAKKSILSKAKDRPDLVKQVVEKMKKEGVRNTLNKVFSKLDNPIPLGYSLSGTIIETGIDAGSFNVGDRVVCAGAGYANHAEINYVPKNLMAKIPDEVDDIDASISTIGAIALQGVRQLNPKIGEKIAVIGLGLIGQLTTQLLKANGCSVISVDIENDRVKLAKKLGADHSCLYENMHSVADKFSNGHGVDSVIIAASGNSSKIIRDIPEIIRMRGRVVVLGMVGLNIPRNDYYKKEIDIRFSMSYGPGRYDPEYEEYGKDYPYDLVRWTEQRNLEAFLELLRTKKLNIKDLITHTYSFDNSLDAYALVEGKTSEKYLGITLKYKDMLSSKKDRTIKITSDSFDSSGINVGFIGAGNFAKSILVPQLRKSNKYNLVGIASSSGISSHSLGKKYGFKYITTDSNSFFNNNEINTVFIATPHSTHAQNVLLSIKNKKHCFVEKPLSINRKELEEIKSSYSGDTIIQVGFNRRFSPMVKKIKEKISGGVSINYRVNAGVIPSTHWIQNREIGGGRIIGEICHFVDTCSYLAGSKVVSVYASSLHTERADIPDSDNINILLNYENGSIATISYYSYGGNTMPKERIEVFGSDISIVMDDFRETVFYSNGKKDKIRHRNQDKGFSGEIESFASSLKSGIPSIPFDSIINTTETTFMILESLRSGKREVIND